MNVIQISYSSPFQFEQHAHSQVLAIGEFDGLHLGHQQVIQRAMERANKLHIPCAIMTFHPHPREVLGQVKYAQYLTPLEDKLALFSEMGIDCAYVVTFDKRFSQISPDQFVRELLVYMNVNSVVVGFDFSFGHLGKGNPDTLCELAHGLFTVEVVRPFHMNGNKVSSTLIRESLDVGHMEKANQLLGRHYQITGKVIQGEGRGRKLGFPTANIQPSGPYVIPANGVYAIKVKFGDEGYSGIMNIGTKPTFTNLTEPVLEAHIFDFDESIYGQHLTIEFVAYIRSERKFSSANELVEQIHQDIEQSKHYLLLNKF